MSYTTESYTQPFRLAPYNPEAVKEKINKEPEYHVFTRYIEQLGKYGIPVVMEMQDYELTTFKNNISEDLPIERKVSVMVRLKSLDLLSKTDKKRKEFLVWYETWTGYKDEGKLPTGEDKLVPYQVCDFPCGMDKQMRIQPTRYDKNGKALEQNPGNFDWVYTELFDTEKIDKILEGTADTDAGTIQFILKVSESMSYGNFSMEEFKQLSFEELEERGKNKLAGTPVVKQIGKRAG